MLLSSCERDTLSEDLPEKRKRERLTHAQILDFSADISKQLAGLNKDIICKPQRIILSSHAKKRKSICFHFKSVQLHRTTKEDAIHLTQKDKDESVLGEIRALGRSSSYSVRHQVAD